MENVNAEKIADYLYIVVAGLSIAYFSVELTRAIKELKKENKEIA